MITIQDMVTREVHCYMSSMVSILAEGTSQLLETRDYPINELCYQAAELCYPIPDYEEAAIQAGWKRDGKHGDGYFHFHKAGHRTIFKDTANAWQEICDYDGIDSIDSEVFEHWAVSTWLAEKLLSYGEKVDTDFAGLCVWARTTTGQAIYADGVIERIYADMMSPAKTEA